MTAVGTHTNRFGEETAFGNVTEKKMGRLGQKGGIGVGAKGTVQRARVRSTVGVESCRCNTNLLELLTSGGQGHPQEILTNCLTRVRQICGRQPTSAGRVFVSRSNNVTAPWQPAGSSITLPRSAQAVAPTGWHAV